MSYSEGQGFKWAQLIVSALAFAGFIAWAWIAFAIWITTDGDCSGPYWCEGGIWPEWTGNAVLAAWFIPLLLGLFAIKKLMRRL